MANGNAGSSGNSGANNMVIQSGLADIASLEPNMDLNNTLDGLAKSLGGLVFSMNDEKRVDTPHIFSGEWTESSTLWVERYEKYSKYAKKSQTEEDKVDFSQAYLSGNALEWNSGASLLYRSWEEYKSAILKKFDMRKNRNEARKHIANMELYRGTIIVNYGKLKRLFEIAGITGDEDQYDMVLEKLNNKDFDKLYGIETKSSKIIMEYLLEEKEK
ncbi:hypothetical protein AYI69_g3726 [Smittium culicis]|uniref:Retrotransposon gag domain-containing protein n=1 Tax=Smittium culicis TaxID=133412 RepID=A0A1R1YIX5_9FUNG|nr:hypothetical protein AYI69_g3726 [Smittium culicis]